MSSNERKTLYTDIRGWGRLIITAASYGAIGLKLSADIDSSLFEELQTENHIQPITPNDEIHWDISEQVHEYLSGHRKNIVASLGILLSGIQREVLEIASAVNYGEVITYKDIAERLHDQNLTGRISSYLRMNPLPLIIPCHRVVKSLDDIGGYVWGKNFKHRLLQLESRYVPKSCGPNNSYLSKFKDS